MQATHCPVCFAALAVREVAPCHDCGHLEQELAHLVAGKHEYAEYRVFGLSVVLCNFCKVDFGSNDPTYFGLSGMFDRDRASLENFEFVRRVGPETAARRDKYCPDCDRRLAFLVFLLAARSRHQSRCETPPDRPEGPA